MTPKERRKTAAELQAFCDRVEKFLPKRAEEKITALREAVAELEGKAGNAVSLKKQRA